MSQLTVFTETTPDQPILDTEDFETIRRELGAAGIRLERWKAERELAPDADSEAILEAYRGEIDKLVAERGYKTYDVVSMNPDHPEKSAFRSKFLSEHTHSEDEVRFFVRGQGLFVIHSDGKVFSMLCTKDDLISVPATTRHWFDMGSSPEFTCIRLFNDPSGWVADFTGDDIAEKFPKLP
ncbi:MAG: acireductone dioxygenase [Myxococcota bacterium]